jgi:DNA polymerase I
LRVIFDIETDSLEPTRIWVIVCRDIDTGEWYVWTESRLREFTEFAKQVTLWVGHNVIAFDIPAIHGLWCRGCISQQSVVDTLVIARTLNYNQPGGNSLEAWGHRLGIHKSSFKDFSKYSEEMLAYCKQDVLVTEALYKKFSKYMANSRYTNSLNLEHQIAWYCNTLSTNGFSYNLKEATRLKAELTDKVNKLLKDIANSFPPRVKYIKTITPRLTKGNTISLTDFRFLPKDPLTGLVDLSMYTAGGAFSRVEYEDFNPRSHKQVIDRMWEFGWEPTSKTKGHLDAERDRDNERLEYFAVYGWKIDDENLDTLPPDAPKAAKTFVEYLLLASRLSALETWEAACLPDPEARQALESPTEAVQADPTPPELPPPWETQETATRPSLAFSEGYRIHGRFNHIGAWTHRMSHAEPNMANIPSHLGRDGRVAAYGREFRSLWQATPGYVLVGTDADSIQLCVLAHYMDDEAFTQALIAGKKEDGTDAHSLNKQALGDVCNSRDVAKTFIYAWLLGAGFRKISQILECTVKQAKLAVEGFIRAYPGLRRLKEETIPQDAARGYFEGFDGRLVLCNSEHYMLAGYLQNGEAVLMKRASVIWNERLTRERIPYRWVDFVHDEWVTETPDASLAEYIGKVQAESIRQAGEEFSLRCPMLGTPKIGSNWYEVHS